MNNFNCEEQEKAIEELLSDIFYIKGISNRSKISSVRIYSELIIRKLLNISIKEYLTLGDKENKNCRSRLRIWQLSSRGLFISA